jgi:hypothetical protein
MITNDEFTSITICNLRHERIDERLFDINFKIDEQSKKINEIYQCLVGNGRAGLNLRISRLEDRESLRNRILTLISVAVLGLSANIIHSWLIK